MSLFSKAVETVIKEAQERGDFDNLSGAGKPLDLSAYFDTPEEIRAAYSLLKNAGMVSPEVELLKEIAELKKIAAALLDEKKKAEINKRIREKQIEFNVRVGKRGK